MFSLSNKNGTIRKANDPVQILLLQMPKSGAPFLASFARSGAFEPAAYIPEPTAGAPNGANPLARLTSSTVITPFRNRIS